MLAACLRADKVFLENTTLKQHKFIDVFFFIHTFTKMFLKMFACVNVGLKKMIMP